MSFWSLRSSLSGGSPGLDPRGIFATFATFSIRPLIFLGNHPISVCYFSKHRLSGFRPARHLCYFTFATFSIRPLIFLGNHLISVCYFSQRNPMTTSCLG